MTRTYADALAAYHLSPESKFENGDRWDRGETQRRHVVAEHVVLIGKEANGVGEFEERVDPSGHPDDIYEPIKNRILEIHPSTQNADLKK